MAHGIALLHNAYYHVSEGIYRLYIIKKATAAAAKPNIDQVKVYLTL